VESEKGGSRTRMRPTKGTDVSDLGSTSCKRQDLAERSPHRRQIVP
jgi:hypothetical protein